MEAFAGRRFYFLTISFRGDLEFNATNTPQILDYWAATRSAIQALYDSGSILGAYWVHELFVRDYLPTRVEPHTHAVIHADHFTQEMVNACCPATINFKNEEFSGVELSPSIMVKPIPTRQDFDKVLGYCTKALPLCEAYTWAFNRVHDEARSQIPALNIEFRNFIEEYPGIIRGHPKIGTIGTLKPQRRDFIGTPRGASRRAQSALLRIARLGQRNHRACHYLLQWPANARRCPLRPVSITGNSKSPYFAEREEIYISSSVVPSVSQFVTLDNYLLAIRSAILVI